MGAIHTARRGEIARTPAGAFTPTSPPGLVAWWDANAITGLTDGQAVATWTDASGNSRNLTQATGANQPLYKTAVQNGKPSVRTDGSNDYLEYIAGADWISTATVTIYIVMTRRSAVGDSCMLAMWANGGQDFNPGTGAMVGWLGTTGNNSNGDYRAVAPRSFISADYGATCHQTTHLWDGTNNTYWRDAVAATASASAGSFAVRGVRIGARGSSLGNYFGADYHEIAMYNAAHSGTDRASMEAYLKAKWGTP